MIAFPLSSVIDIISKTVLGILYLNLLSGCIFSMSCMHYIPTLSRLASFRTHDLVVTMSLTLFSLALVVLFVAFHLKTKGKITKDDLIFMITIEAVVASFTILEGIIDETNAIDFLYLDNLHRFISICLCITSLAWAYFAIAIIERDEAISEELLKKCKICYKLGVVFSALTLYEWHFAYTIYYNFFTNFIAESFCEWVLITMAIRFPYYFSAMLDISISPTKKKN